MKKITACSLTLIAITGSCFAAGTSAAIKNPTPTTAIEVPPLPVDNLTPPPANIVPPTGEPVIPLPASAKLKIPPAVLNQNTKLGLTAGAPKPYSLLPYITVSTSPYIAQKSAFDASDIWSQQSTMNEDLFLLQYKQGFEHALNNVGTSLSHRPIVELSGAIEAAATQNIHDFGDGTSGDINLNTAELDINAMASKWATAFMSFEFDNSPPDIGSRVTNSRLYLSRGFAVIGDLDVSPFYLTAGQFYLPFGRFASYMVTSPVTLSLARINDRAVLLGYVNGGFFGSIYAYPGINSDTNDSIFRQGGANVGYKMLFAPDKGSLTIGAGFVSDMSASQGIANTGGDQNGSSFPGFSRTLAGPTYPFEHGVPGADIHSEFNYGQWTLTGEFISATTSYASEDMTYNGDGAAPKASHIDLWRVVTLGNRDWMFGTSYGHTWEALALNLPENSLDGYVRTSFWKNTVEELEFRHDTDYDTDDKTTAATEFGNYTNQGTGSTREIILAQVGVYF